MITAKHGSRPIGVKAVMKKAWDYYRLLCKVAGIEPVQTDGMRNPKHKYSLHQDGFAIDLRLRDLSIDQGKAFKAAMQKYLGNNYDVIYDEDSKHIHVEYQRYLDDQKEWNIKPSSVRFVD